MKKGTQVIEDNTQNKILQRNLNAATMSGNTVEVFKLVVELRQNNSLIFQGNNNNSSDYLHAAINKIHPEITEILIFIGRADVNKKNSFGQTPIERILLDLIRHLNMFERYVNLPANFQISNLESLIPEKTLKLIRCLKHLLKAGAHFPNLELIKKNKIIIDYAFSELKKEFDQENKEKIKKLVDCQINSLNSVYGAEDTYPLWALVQDYAHPYYAKFLENYSLWKLQSAKFEQAHSTISIKIRHCVTIPKHFFISYLLRSNKSR